ncbi:MAG: hypothetical protein NT133_23020 [Alphaproteobacteria bacterium]|nr:hypothetical protein [Alphaproteobacteria bacterium]
MAMLLPFSHFAWRVFRRFERLVARPDEGKEALLFEKRSKNFLPI